MILDAYVLSADKALDVHLGVHARLETGDQYEDKSPCKSSDILRRSPITYTSYSHRTSA